MTTTTVPTTTNDALQNIQTFRSWARDYYEPQALRHYDRAIARMLKLLNPPPGSEVLDAGCGTGVHSARVARAGFRVRAVDISAVALEQANRHAEEVRVASNIHFQRADLTQLPFADGAFRSIFSWGVVIHIPDIEAALRELVRVMAPGGRLALQITNGAAMDHAAVRLARQVLRKPAQRIEHTEYGPGLWEDGPVGRLWTVLADVPRITRFVEAQGCRRLHRSPSEFTELQRRVRGLPRTMLRVLNSTWFALRLPAAPACTNLLVFEKAR